MNIQDLMKRYSLSSRSALYRRVNALGLELSKNKDGKVFATDEHILLLDKLHSHIRGGGKISSFLQVSSSEVVEVQRIRHSVVQQDGQSRVQQTNPIELLEKLVGAIASNFSAKSPIQVHQQLAQVEANEWLLTTTEVGELVGKKPSRRQGYDFCQIGGWKFVSVGKAGNQLLWKVEKLKVDI